MRVLEYESLDTTGAGSALERVRDALSRGDFRAAQAKKLVGGDGRLFYRAKLGDADRLLFTLVRHREECCILLLERIRQHDYAASRFLRGADIDEERIVDVGVEEAVSQAVPMRYLHPARTRVHLLDKPLSFDDVQQAVFEAAPPLVLVGSAGSGKTALTLEKLKRIEGEVLYVTHSAYLAQSARALYFGGGFEHPRQQAEFLSYREFIETFAVPVGQEASWPRFRGWFARMQQGFRGLDAHQAFEEIRGVIAAQADGPLTRENYLGLGVRQSIYAPEQRAQVYDLYRKYREWLLAERLYDLNLLAHEHLAQAQPRYDFVVVDEVQDLTMAQLALVLKSLRHPGQFLLCGDSNQIVHPNFFAWSQVKTLFWRDAELAARQPLRVLAANYRNAARTTALANTLLRVKHARFGSIDRESNHLVEAVGGETGKATLLADREAALRVLDEQTRRSARVAVLVLRDEDKPAARERFRTPLLFSVHEAKGLEYEHIVLFRFVSGQRAAYAEIAEGVDAGELTQDTLEYRRARDKTDKSLEVWKFYVNALYVALTRALRDVWLVESDLQHPLLQLLGLREEGATQLDARASSQEEWQREARRLELQGKQEQADAIRRDVLKQARPPWPVHDGDWLRASLRKAFIERHPSAKLHQQLFDYACYHNRPTIAQALHDDLRYSTPENFLRQAGAERTRTLAPCLAKNFKDLLRQCDQYGTEFRSPMNHTPLMQAALAGNLPLLEALIERGADLDAADDYGQTALHLAIQRSARDQDYARRTFAPIYARVAPAVFDVQCGGRLVRLDRHQPEYQLLQWMWALAAQAWTLSQAHATGFDAAWLLGCWEAVPDSVVPATRKRRQYLSSVLSRNEAGRDYAWNRRLFARLRHGYYWLAADLAVRVREAGEERWMDHRERLGMRLLLDTAADRTAPALARRVFGEDAGASIFAAERQRRQQAREQAEEARAQREHEQLMAEIERRQREHNAQMRWMARQQGKGIGSMRPRAAAQPEQDDKRRTLGRGQSKAAHEREQARAAALRTAAMSSGHSVSSAETRDAAAPEILKPEPWTLDLRKPRS
ncbi:MAG: ankyrin repeat domain-containing protein [Xanthomonadales bacterium]|nr:hypothetical protein [Xanthomonadales bacterium]MCC6593453.1 ankyrin repeat domain-containing protein [Xanthomonadales bacterium]MCE7929794.1 hypothetical protein [Xanthomonadales bacterium PRO6]